VKQNPRPEEMQNLVRSLCTSACFNHLQKAGAETEIFYSAPVPRKNIKLKQKIYLQHTLKFTTLKVELKTHRSGA